MSNKQLSWLDLYCGQDPDMPYFTAAERQDIQAMFKSLRPKNLPALKGKIIIMGTGGDIDAGSDFKSMFYTPPEL